MYPVFFKHLFQLSGIDPWQPLLIRLNDKLIPRFPIFLPREGGGGQTELVTKINSHTITTRWYRLNDFRSHTVCTAVKNRFFQSNPFCWNRIDFVYRKKAFWSIGFYLSFLIGFPPTRPLVRYVDKNHSIQTGPVQSLMTPNTIQ